jgi:hypothetical protein
MPLATVVLAGASGFRKSQEGAHRWDERAASLWAGCACSCSAIRRAPRGRLKARTQGTQRRHCPRTPSRVARERNSVSNLRHLRRDRELRGPTAQLGRHLALRKKHRVLPHDRQARPIRFGRFNRRSRVRHLRRLRHHRHECPRLRGPDPPHRPRSHTRCRPRTGRSWNGRFRRIC